MIRRRWSFLDILYGCVLCWVVQCMALWVVKAEPLLYRYDWDDMASNDSNTTIPPTDSNTTNPNTIAPRPTSPAPAQVFYWNSSCVSLAVTNISFEYEHPALDFNIVTDVPLLNLKYNVTGPRVKGPCYMNSGFALLELYWRNSNVNATDSFNLTFKFGQVGGQWEATEILHSDSDHKPFKYADQDYFKSPLATAFSCSHRMTHSLDTRASLEFIDIKVQAFTLDNSFSKSVNTCPDNLKPSNQNLALIIGASIGSVALVGVLAVLFGKSAHREYELLK